VEIGRLCRWWWMCCSYSTGRCGPIDVFGRVVAAVDGDDCWSWCVVEELLGERQAWHAGSFLSLGLKELRRQPHSRTMPLARIGTLTL